MSKELIERFPEINYSNYDHDDVHVLQNWALEAIDELTKQAERIEKLRTRLSAQMHQTQITAQQIHDAVLAAIKRGTTFPDGIDEQGHPIEQLVGMIVTTLQLKLDEQAERVKALEDQLAAAHDTISAVRHVATTLANSASSDMCRMGHTLMDLV